MPMANHSFAIAHNMMKKKMARGGMCEHGSHNCEMCHGGRMAEGGMIHEEERSGYREMPEDYEKMNRSAEHEDDRMLNEEEHEDTAHDLVSRIMRDRAKHYARGGEVDDDFDDHPDSDSASFEREPDDKDFAKTDYTGENSGDEIGDEKEDEEDRDVVSRIMKQRRLKGRMPHPA